MGFFNSLPVPEFREWVFSIPFPFPNPQKSFPLTPVLDGGHYCAGLFETYLIRNTDITSMWIKIGGSLEIGLSSVVSPFAFWAIKKSGRSFVALFGTGVACAGWLLASFAENEVVFLSAKALLGGGFGLMYIASVSTVNAAFDRH